MLSARYGGPPTPASGTTRPGYGKHAQGVAAFEDAQFIPSDPLDFQGNFSLPREPVKVLGPNKGGYYGEASLDTQYIFSVGSGVQTWFLAQEQFDLLAWSWLVMNMTSPPAVLSVSWGGGESNYDLQHQHAANAEFAKMGLKGHTVLAASGDDGTGKHGGLFTPCKMFDPTWPASSPYVTAVGGTYLTAGGDGDGDAVTSETGWSSSGGGFSTNFAAPDYQANAIASYKSKTQLPPADHFNASGRVTPDVAAAATNFQLLTKGAWGCLSGTSASTPVFAGMVSLVNDALVGAGKPTVGFINPALYRAASVGFDVTEGNNKAQFCPAGFSAAEGFDAVTGWGSPTWEKLQAALMA